MKIAFALLALALPAHAADLNFHCQGKNLILDNLQSIEWSRDQIALNGTMNGRPYRIFGSFTRAYSANGYAYSTSYGEVIVPFELVNGAQRQANVEISNSDYPNEKALCTRL